MTKKKGGKASPKPAFPAKELEKWFRSEVKQLTETVRQLQKNFERSGRPRPTKRARTRHAAPAAAKTTTAKRRTRPARPGVAAAPHAR